MVENIKQIVLLVLFILIGIIVIKFVMVIGLVIIILAVGVFIGVSLKSWFDNKMNKKWDE